MKFDAGPLITLKPELNLSELEENAVIDEKYIEVIAKIAEHLIKKNKENEVKKHGKINNVITQRIAINCGADEKQEFNVVLGATLPSTATEQKIQELTGLYGHAIVAEKDLTGIVHYKLSKMDPKEASYKHTWGLFLSFMLKKHLLKTTSGFYCCPCPVVALGNILRRISVKLQK